MAAHIEASPRGPSHVTFAHSVSQGVSSLQPRSTMATASLSSPLHDEPATPPWNSHDLPTPPNSHINMTSLTRPPPPQQSNLPSATLDASTSQINSQDTLASVPDSSNQSPSMQVHQRRAQRISAGSSSAVAVEEDAASSPTFQQPAPATERDIVLSEVHRGRSRTRERDDVSNSSSRSRTPSPILGSIVDSNGHLSFAASLVPSADEVRSLLYGEDDELAPANEAQLPAEVSEDELQSLLNRLASMGVAKGDGDEQERTREQELAGMVTRLIDHSKHQQRTLHDTRIRAISLLTSLRTTFAHTLASEYGLRARVEAELEGARSQAKKLSVMLARSESRNEEMDKERAMSAEEEVLWQEEMKDHASAYAQQQAARARAAQMAQAQSQLHSQRQTSDAIKLEPTGDDDELSKVGLQSSPLAPISSLAQEGTTGLDETVTEKRADESAVTGLGISAGPAEPILGVAALTASPLSTIVKERNKLLADKRYLKSRVKDTEAQRDRLEMELKALRPLLVRGPASKSAAAAHIAAGTPNANNIGPSTPGRSQKRDRSRRRRQATMGDAQAEHLLLAARRLKELNRMKEGEDDGRPSTPPPASGTTHPRTPKTPRTGTTTTPKSMASREMMDSIYASGASSRIMPNGSPLAGKVANSANSLGRWGTHERVDSAMSGSGIEDLLQAAQTVLTPEKKSAHRQSHTRSKSGPDQVDSEQEGEDDGDFTLSQNRALLPGIAFSSKDLGPLNESPKRRRVSSAALEGSRSGLALSPDKRGAMFQSGRRPRTSTEGAEPFLSQSSSIAGLTALDLLADQAAASQHPSQSSDPSGSGEGEANMGPEEGYGSDEDEGMMVDDQEEIGRARTEGGIGSHYYPRGAYGHPYAQQPPTISHDGYRMSSQPGYTYSPNSSLASQSWSSQTSTNAPRNGLYAPRGVSPPPGASRYASAFPNGPRLSTGNISHHLPPKNTNRQSNSPEEFATQHNNNNNNHNNRTPQRGGNTSPDKRLPYVRWSDEEDQKLRKAINEYGQRWESVARVVGTRSYHQCRQRYLLMRRKEAAARDGTVSSTSVTAT